MQPPSHDRKGDHVPAIGPDVRPVLLPAERVIDPLEAVDPATGRLVHSVAPRKPRTIGGAIYLVVLALAVGSLGVVAAGWWRVGCAMLGVAFLVATAGRIVVPDDQAGMLKLRRKAIDVPTLLFIGVALVGLAAVVPARFV